MKFWHKLFAQAYDKSLKWIFTCIYKTKVVILSANVLAVFDFAITLTLIRNIIRLIFTICR